jgi:hypothetical protein
VRETSILEHGKKPIVGDLLTQGRLILPLQGKLPWYILSGTCVLSLW